MVTLCSDVHLREPLSAAGGSTLYRSGLSGPAIEFRRSLHWYADTPENYLQGRSDGGYIGIYTPQNQSTQNNLCGYSSPVIQDR